MSQQTLENFLDADIWHQVLHRSIAEPQRPDYYDFCTRRLTGLIPPELVRDKRVLDLGSCYGTVGCWALLHGAKHYTGVEIQTETHQTALKQFGSAFDSTQFNLTNQTILDFFATNDEKFDIVCLFGVLQITPEYDAILRECAKRCRMVLIDNTHPHVYSEMLTEMHNPNIYDEQDADLLHTLLESRTFREQFRTMLEKKLPVAYYRQSSTIFVADNNKDDAVRITGNYLSLGLCRNFFDILGWRYHDYYNEDLKHLLKEVYNFPGRYGALFECVGDTDLHRFEEYFNNGQLTPR